MTGLEAFKIVYNNFDYLISDVCIENDDVNICLKTIKEQLPTIKQALIKVEKEHKALEIIKEKVMPLVSISDGCVWDGERYHGIAISEEDSILLKEVLSNERN